MQPSSSANTTAGQERALALLRDAESFLLTGHVRPDGDCVGAQAALSRVLTALGKRVAIVNPDPVEARYDYLAREVDYGVYDGGPLPEHRVAVLLDFHERTRSGRLEAPLKAAGAAVLVVDHHPFDGEPWWDAAFLDFGAAATGLLVHRIARRLGVALDRVAAAGVFTSIVSDTGWLRYSNTDAETLRCCADLVEAGVEPSELFGAIHQRNRADHPGALGRLLGSLEYHAGGRLALLRRRLVEGAALDAGVADEALDVVRSVGTVEVVLYVAELPAGGCKLSARSKTDYDVNELARRFGGGGHRRASGATLPWGIDEACERLVSAALEPLRAVPEVGR